MDSKNKIDSILEVIEEHIILSGSCCNCPPDIPQDVMLDWEWCDKAGLKVKLKHIIEDDILI